MTEFITLTCPDCNSKFNITNDITRFACANCEKEFVVKRGGGMVYLHQTKGENIVNKEEDLNSPILEFNFQDIQNKKIKLQELFAFSDIIFSIGLIFLPIFSFKLFSDGIDFEDIIFFITLFSPLFIAGWHLRKQEYKENAGPENHKKR